MIGDLGRVVGSQIYSLMLVSWCFPYIFRQEAACYMCVVWDGTVVWEVFVDTHGNIKSQQPILLQKIEHLKQVYKKYLSRALTRRRGLLIPSSCEEMESVQSDSIWSGCNWQHWRLWEEKKKKGWEETLSHSSICSQPVLMASVISGERVIMRERERGWGKQEKYTFF